MADARRTPRGRARGRAGQRYPLTAADLSMDDRAELANLYHAARVALEQPTRYTRLCYAAREFCKVHSSVPHHVAYIAADRCTNPAGPELP